MLPPREHLFVLVYLAYCCGSTFGDFLAVAPNEFRPGWNLSIAVTVHKNAKENVNIDAALRPSDDKIDLYSYVSDSISPGETKLISMLIPEIVLAPQSQATLTVTTTGGVIHSSQHSVLYNPTSSLVFVETDKAIYKPGQKVQIRVVHVDKGLKPVINPLTVYIVNPKESKLEEYKNITSRTGVVEITYELLQSASLGQWKIHVKDAASMMYSKEFTVEEYVLPKFSVTAKANPGYILFENGITDCSVTVEAIYTYGKGVQGNCDLVLSVEQKGKETHLQTSKQLNEAGKAEFSNLEWAQFANSINAKDFKVQVIASVTDETGRTEVGQTSVMFHKYGIKIDILPNTTRVFRSGIPASIFVRVSDHSGNPIDKAEVQLEIHIPQTKYVDSTVVVPEGETDVAYHFTPEIEAKEKQDHFYHYDYAGTITARLASNRNVVSTLSGYLYQSKNNSVITVQPASDKIPKVGETVQYKVLRNSDDVLHTVSYAVISQGNIVEAGVPVDDLISIIPTMEMCPQAKLFVYMIAGAETAEVVVDFIDFSPTHCLSKEVGVSFDASEIRSGTDTTMKVHVNRVDGSNALPGVHNVYYLGIDKSLVLLQGRTDLNKDGVMLEVSNLNLKSRAEELEGFVPHSAAKIIEALGLAEFTTVFVKQYRRFWNRAHIVPKSKMRNEHARVDQVFKESMEQPKILLTSDEPVNVKVRKNFPETWLWGRAQTDVAGHLSQAVTLPDTITTWMVSAFAVGDDGLAVGSGPFEVEEHNWEGTSFIVDEEMQPEDKISLQADQTLSLRQQMVWNRSSDRREYCFADLQLAGFQVFFLTMNLPYSIKRGEVFVLRVTVFNYRKKGVDAVVRLANSNQFSVVDEKQDDSGWVPKQAQIFAGRASSVEFKIKTTTLGLIELHVVAEDVDDGVKDEVRRNLLVKPEGEMRSRAITQVFYLKSQPSIAHTFVLSWPEDKIVPGSKRVEVKVTGVILGQALSNLQRLVSMPCGCGEQNMITTVPNIYGLTYIQATGQQDDHADLLLDMIKNMKTGYQRQVDLYRHKDGSYSAWGERGDSLGSVWLTAFVLKSFSRAGNFISVDNTVLSSAAKFLSNAQQSSGAFIETGQVFHSEMQSGTGSGPSLTLYVLISLLEAHQAMRGDLLDLKMQINLALGYIQQNLEPAVLKKDNNKFLAAMGAYAVSLVPNNTLASLVQELLNVVTDQEAPWTETSSSSNMNHYDRIREMSRNIEIASYYLLALTQLAHYEEGLDIVKWLQSQQNSLGGYYSTQDTVMALQAISQFGAAFKGSSASLVKVREPQSGQSFNVNLEGSKAMLLQTVELPEDTKTVEVTVTGQLNSSCVVKVVYTYYTLAGDDDLALNESQVSVETKTQRLSDSIHNVVACVRSSNTLKYSGMFVTTLTLPSGEEAFDDPSTILGDNPKASRVETSQGVIHFYMNEAPGEGYCLKAKMERQMDFEVQKPGSAKIYAYYEPGTAQEVALVMDDSQCKGSTCGSDKVAVLNLTNIALTMIICMFANLLVCM